MEATLHTVTQYALYNGHSEVCSIQYTIYNMQYTIYRMYFTVHSMQYTVYSLQYMQYAIFIHDTVYRRHGRV